MKVLLGFKHTSTGFSTHGLPDDCPAGSAESDDCVVLHTAETDMDMHVFIEEIKTKATALRNLDKEHLELDYALNDAEHIGDTKEVERLRAEMSAISDWDQPREIRMERLRIRNIMKFKTFIIVDGNPISI